MAGYGTDERFASWLTANGLTLPAGAPEPAILRQRGSEYLDSVYGSRFLGRPADGALQERAWPRTGAVVYGSTLDDSVTPVAIEHASYYAAYYEATKPGALLIASSNGGAIKRKKVDVLEIEYFEPTGDALDANTMRLLAADGLVKPFLRSDAEAIIIRSVG